MVPLRKTPRPPAIPAGWLALILALGLLVLPSAPPLGAQEAPEPQPDPAVAGDPAEGRTAGEAPDLPPGVLARVNGQDVTVQAYAEYLLASVGKARLDEYIDRLLIDEAARRHGISIRPEDVEALVEEQIQRTIQGLYQGSRERLLESLERYGTTLEERKARLRQEMYYDRLLTLLILRDRTVTEDEVRAEFERVYGPGGVRPEIRHILVSTRTGRGPGGELVQRAESEARERAERILAELRSGADFAAMVEKHSEDPLTRPNEGRLPYRAGELGEEFDAAVARLGETAPLSGVVRSPRGFHIIQWVGMEKTDIEDVRESIEERLRERPPPEAERQAKIRALREEARIVR